MTSRRLMTLVLLVALAGVLGGCTVNGTVIATEQERESFPTGATPIRASRRSARQ